MKEQQLMELSKILNTLAMVSTKGEDTLVMADCMRALQQFIQMNAPQPELPKEAE